MEKRKTKVLITVKTYPTLSAKYHELVCTAGFLEDGGWVRIYPVPFREKPYHEQYKKYEWIEVDLVRKKSDFRPESYKPYSVNSEINVIGSIPADGDAWHERRKYILEKNPVYNDLKQLIADAKDKGKYTSLAIFKPAKIDDLIIKPVDREWDSKKLETLNQLKLFESDKKGRIEVVRKLPYKFSYKIKDDKGKESTMMIEDWEIGQLYWNALARNEGNENKACSDVKKKYIDDFAKTKDLHLFLGTTQAHHLSAKNPFVIIGTFHPKPITQMKLF